MALADIERLKHQEVLGIRPLRVLVIDHEEADSTIITLRAVKRLGHITEFAGSYLKALDLCSSGEFDLIFLDLNLGGETGIGLIGKIRSLLPKTHVVAMTASSSREQEIQARQQRVIFYLVKPFSSNEVLSIVNHLAKKWEKSTKQT